MSSTLDDLSQSLSVEEKKEMLGRIQASLHLADRDTDHIITKAAAPEELRHRLSKEVDKLGFFERLMVRFLAFFRNRSEADVLIDRKLAATKTVLRDRCPELVSFTRGEWTPEFARMVYDLYAEAALLKPVFEHWFQQKLTLEAGLMRLIEEEHPQAVRRLEDLFPEDDMAGAYLVDSRRTSLGAELNRRLERALEAVPGAVFDHVRLRLKPLYYLRPLVMFPYAFLFEPFGLSPEKDAPVKYPYFLAAPWRKTAGLLERLYYGIHLASKLDPADLRLTELFERTAEHLADGAPAVTAETLQRRLVVLIRQAQETAARAPWREILQWGYQDPYYGVKFVLPQFSVDEFYRTSLSVQLREELDRCLPEVRQRLLDEERTFLFKNGGFDPLDFYVPGVGASLGPQRVRGFQYPETLGLLWAFLNHHFAKKIVPYHQALARMAAPGGKSTTQGLTNIVDDLQGLRQRIRAFDRSLHPDAEEGKVFHRLKVELGAKTLSLKPFLQIVQTKDSEALDLVRRGAEGLSILRNQLAGLRDRNVPALQAVLKLPYLLEGQQETFENGLDRLLVIVQKTQFVLKETESLEN